MIKNLFRKIDNKINFQMSDGIFLAVGLIVFSAIVIFTISKSSIWFDEAFGAYLSHFNFFEIARYTAADVHPPFYYWLLKIWGGIFGYSEIGLRSMSLLFGLISIILGYLLLVKLFNKKTARISLIFMVLSPMIIRYSQEARMYTLVTAIALAATYTLVIAIDSKKRLPWVVYGILVSLGMWTHYFSALVWLAHWIWRADIIKQVSKKGEFIKKFFTKEWLMAHIIAVILFIPWLPMLFYQLVIVQAAGFWISPVTPDTIINFITNIIYYLDVDKVISWLAFGFIAITFVVCYISFKLFKDQSKKWRESYKLILFLSIVPVVLLFLSSMPPLRPSFIDRYLIPSTFMIALFIGVTFSYGISVIGRKKQIGLIAILSCMMMFGVYNVWQYGNYNKTLSSSNNTRQIVEQVVSKASDGQPIISSTPWLFYEINFYETKSHLTYFINEKTDYKYGSLDMLKYNSDHKIMDVSSFAKSNPVVWYVGYPGDDAFDPPYSNWQKLQEISMKDPVTGKASYKAIQYKINN